MPITRRWSSSGNAALRKLIGAGVLVSLLIASGPILGGSGNSLAASQIQSASCASCHSTSQPARKKAGKAPPFVDASILKGSIHRSLSCTACHEGMGAVPHPKKPPRPTCGKCHGRESRLFDTGIHGQELRKGNPKAPECYSCHGSHNIRKAADRQSLVFPANLPRVCVKCHLEGVEKGREAFRQETGRHREPFPSYLSSIHWKTLEEKGIMGVALCNDCHESHDLKPMSDPRSPINRKNIPETCGRCHIGILTVYNASIHGQAMRAGRADAPVCTDCHGEHTIETAREKSSTISSATISRTTCPRCHSAERIVDHYGVVSQRVTRFLDSYHGVESRAGRPVVANCASCHGTHDIRASSDPLSSVNKANLPHTCGQCHPGAGANFAKGTVHASKQKDAVTMIVRKIYFWLILLTIGGMLGHNTVVMGREFVNSYKKHRADSAVRFSKSVVIQHILTNTSFSVLAITGFALHFPDAWWSSWLVRAETGAVFRGFLHRLAAAVLTGVCLYHVYYVIRTGRGRKEVREIFPSFKDAKHGLLLLKRAALGTREDIDFGRYIYAEKLEYWALAWGTVVMMVTGFPMWFPDVFMRFFPRWILDLLRAIHYYEAWLAVLAVVVWHFFHVMFHPETYPMNWTWLTGRMSIEELKKRPREYERVVLAGKNTDGSKSAHTKDSPAEKDRGRK
ncbi:MAG: cytochrome c3 family protein [Candidatus Eisenbacteria bacterium]|nr:cytochrome c3 family protein [Candidatus Eisenbacteria bacterium]